MRGTLSQSLPAKDNEEINEDVTVIFFKARQQTYKTLNQRLGKDLNDEANPSFQK